jgi:hypothetical protein
VLARRRQGLVARGRPCDDAEVRLLLEQRGERRPHAGVVVRDDDGDLTAGWGRHREQAGGGASFCPDARAPVV